MMTHWILDGFVEPIVERLQARFGVDRLALVAYAEVTRAPTDFALIYVALHLAPDSTDMPMSSFRLAVIAAAGAYMAFRLHVAYDLAKMASGEASSPARSTRWFAGFRQREVFIQAFCVLFAALLSSVGLTVAADGNPVGILALTIALAYLLWTLFTIALWNRVDVLLAQPIVLPDDV